MPDSTLLRERLLTRLTAEPIVYLVDDDPLIRQWSTSLLSGLCAQVIQLESGPEFLAAYRSEHPGCLITDYSMPDMDGLELIQRMRDLSIDLSVIMISGRASVRTAVDAIRRGAVDFLEKPLDASRFETVVRRALDRDRARFELAAMRSELLARISRLTPREREVMDHLVEGKTMKQIASQWNVAVQTVAKHRARVLDKLEVDNEIGLIHSLLSLRVDLASSYSTEPSGSPVQLRRTERP